MSTKIYRNQFFKTDTEAFAFQEKHGGIVYSNAKYSHTKQSYMVEAKQIACLSDDFIAEHPYCVAWNQSVYCEHVMGDLLQANADLIVHQVNCQGVMGAGVARQIREQFPKTYETYKEFCKPYVGKTHKLLGQCLYVEEEPFIICNAFGQDFYYRNSVQTQYDKLEQCFYDIAEKYHGKSIALPWKIGCGLAGGDWNVVYEMIFNILAVEGHCKVTLYEYQG